MTHDFDTVYDRRSTESIKWRYFGEALPMACDETAVGRQLNRRDELWLRPDFPDQAPAPEDPRQRRVTDSVRPES